MTGRKVVSPLMAGGLVILGHLGLGDLLVCNGLVRHFARAGGQVIVVCKTCSATSVKHMYRDMPNIHALPVLDDDAISPRFGADQTLLLGFVRAGMNLLLLGRHAGAMQPGSLFADAFYWQAGIDKGVRYSHFFVRRDAAVERSFEQARPYVFVHDDADRGFSISVDTDLPVVRPGKADERPHSDNVFAFIGLMERAVELHCIDSAFSHLADLLDILPGKRYLHANVKNPEDRVEELFLRPGWTFVR